MRSTNLLWTNPNTNPIPNITDLIHYSICHIIQSLLPLFLSVILITVGNINYCNIVLTFYVTQSHDFRWTSKSYTLQSINMLKKRTWWMNELINVAMIDILFVGIILGACRLRRQSHPVRTTCSNQSRKSPSRRFRPILEQLHWLPVRQLIDYIV